MSELGIPHTKALLVHRQWGPFKGLDLATNSLLATDSRATAIHPFHLVVATQPLLINPEVFLHTIPN